MDFIFRSRVRPWAPHRYAMAMINKLIISDYQSIKKNASLYVNRQCIHDIFGSTEQTILRAKFSTEQQQLTID
jgi:hypothetical protein